MGRAAALMSLTPACATQALFEDAAHDDEDAYRRLMGREVGSSAVHAEAQTNATWPEVAVQADGAGDLAGAHVIGALVSAPVASFAGAQAPEETSRQAEGDIEPLEVDLGDRLGVLSEGRLAVAAPVVRERLRTVPRETMDGAERAAAPADVQATASFRWRSPFAGRFRVEFWPEEEPPFRYQLRVLERSGGRVLHDSEAYGSGVVFEVAAGSELQIAVRVTQPAGDNRYRLELHEADRAT